MNIQNINLTIEELNETSSTNSYLTNLCKEKRIPEYHTVITENQTAGRGQRGNYWESECRKNLTFSTVLYPNRLEIRKHFHLSMTISLAILHTLKDYTNEISIKWPNDIYWKDKKMGGILIENQLEGKYITQSIIGIGININQKIFHSSAPNPISLCQVLDCDVSREEVFNKIMTCLIDGYTLLQNKKEENTLSLIHSLYKNNLYRKEGFHWYRDTHGEFEAELYDVESNGYLVLKDKEGKLRSYGFKEVEFILP